MFICDSLSRFTPRRLLRRKFSTKPDHGMTLYYQIKKLTSITSDDINTQLISGVLDTKAQNKLQVTDNVHASQLWFLFLFNYFSIEVGPMILSVSAPLIQAANIGSIYQDLKNIQKGDWRMLHESTIFENLIWSLLDISFPYLLVFSLSSW